MYNIIKVLRKNIRLRVKNYLLLFEFIKLKRFTNGITVKYLITQVQAINQ